MGNLMGVEKKNPKKTTGKVAMDRADGREERQQRTVRSLR